MKTLEQLDGEIQALVTERRQVEEATLNQTLLGMFAQMDKEQILGKIQEMMEASPMLKSEVKRLLITNNEQSI